MKELLLKYIKVWLNDLINCRTNRLKLEEANKQLLTLKNKLKDYESRFEFLKQESVKQASTIKDIKSQYDYEKEKSDKLSKVTVGKLNQVIKDNKETYNNISIDQEGLDLINQLIKEN